MGEQRSPKADMFTLSIFMPLSSSLLTVRTLCSELQPARNDAEWLYSSAKGHVLTLANGVK